MSLDQGVSLYLRIYGRIPIYFPDRLQPNRLIGLARLAIGIGLACEDWSQRGASLPHCALYVCRQGPPRGPATHVLFHEGWP